METQLEKFAEYVRRECVRIIGANAAKNYDLASEIAFALSGDAWNLAEQSKMQREATEGNYDLATLNVPSTSTEPEGD